MRIIGPEEIKALHPLCDVTDIDCALYTEGDGHVDPSALSNSYRESAKKFGNMTFTRCEVKGTQEDGSSTASNPIWNVAVEVTANNGDKLMHTVQATHVVNCAHRCLFDPRVGGSG